VARRVHLTGGGTLIGPWPEILADVLGRELGISPNPGFEECVGAARCAWVAIGRFANVDATVRAGSPWQLVQPSTDRHRREVSTAAYARYLAAADAVWALQQELAGNESGR
jgi:sugar (pentulose or hexulose) kinase